MTTLFLLTGIAAVLARDEFSSQKTHPIKLDEDSPSPKQIEEMIRDSEFDSLCNLPIDIVDSEMSDYYVDAA